MNEPYDCTPPTVTLDELIAHLQSLREESGNLRVVFLDEVMGFMTPVELDKLRVTGKNLSYVTHEWSGRGRDRSEQQRTDAGPRGGAGADDQPLPD